MAEILKCPNCNAMLHSVYGGNVLKCEYCDTEVIINNNIQNFPQQMNSFPQQTNGFPQQMNRFLNHYVSNRIYSEEIKKWKKSFRKYLIIQAVLSAFFGLFMEAAVPDIGVITLFASIIYSFVLPFCLLKKKPFSPLPQDNNKFLDFMKIYPLFAGAFWGGMIIVAIIVTI